MKWEKQTCILIQSHISLSKPARIMSILLLKETEAPRRRKVAQRGKQAGSFFGDLVSRKEEGKE